MSSETCVLAFSGGLDTSFCVPYLIDKGYRVVTLFVDTGGVDADERRYIEERARLLGAAEHVMVDGADDLWREFCVPFVAAGQLYQDQYPLLVSDRYIIVREALALADKLGTRVIAHGCTGMGNDQVRFDLSVRAQGDYQIVAPIREIQEAHENVRAYEQSYLSERGFEVRAKTARYSINENLLGVTASGSEIDEWKPPGPETYALTRPASEWPREPLRVTITFERGAPFACDGQVVDGPALLADLNRRFGAYGVGRSIYTGDTIIGLKGRIVFEAPGLLALLVAHRALEEAVLTREQNHFKAIVGRKWVELVYGGFFYEPLTRDLEAFLASSQQRVEGTVVLETCGGSVVAVEVESPWILRAEGAVYAQSASWGAREAEGFIQLLGQSAGMAAVVHRGKGE